MSIPDINNLLTLDVETRLVLVQKLWDSIFEDAEGGSTLPLSPPERELLDARLKEDDDDPESAVSWDEARAELLRER
ncbi:MAG TPA: addiction module protein [Kofleriaceae bacterium]|jgi:putative addiction module component (TIGR02574 family)